MPRITRITVRIESASTDGAGPMFSASDSRAVDGRELLERLDEVAKEVLHRFEQTAKDYVQRHGAF